MAEQIQTEQIHYDESGLVPAIVQDAATGKVLMLAWMNAEALQKTLETGETVFWSRSRQEIWRKGATSGNVQRVVEARLDCDGDAVLLRVHPAGPACHTGEVSCFYRAVGGGAVDKEADFTLGNLYEIIRDRRDHSLPGSYTSSLFAEGQDEIVKKVGEEAIEVILAANAQGEQRLVEEIADLVYHLLVLLAARDLTLQDIQAELARRHQ